MYCSGDTKNLIDTIFVFICLLKDKKKDAAFGRVFLFYGCPGPCGMQTACGKKRL